MATRAQPALKRDDESEEPVTQTPNTSSKQTRDEMTLLFVYL